MRRGGGGARRLRIPLAAAAVLVLLLGLAQLLLPRIASSRISSRVGRYGNVESVSVSAWPAVKLLWGSADSVRVRAGQLSLSPAQAAKLLWEGHRVDRLDFTARSVRLGSLRVSEASVRKRGSALSAQARASEVDIRAALPKGAYVPFGAGSRTCIGMRFGQLEVRTIATLILSRFTLSLPPGFELAIRQMPTISPKHGLPMRVHARTAAAVADLSAVG